MELKCEWVYSLLPDDGREFNSTDVNRLLDDEFCPITKTWSLDTEAILTELREQGKVARGSSDHCFWYIKIPNK